ncbi:MAG: effector binding domain-containing protein [Gammaproteobacteria bacterium]|nr:effector binding domain-containing protein [Gammaproteobacteria bacterium]
MAGLISTDIFSVYSDYEDGYKGKYKTTIGYAVSDPASIPEGLSVVTIPARSYKKFPAKSGAPVDIIAAWQTIWATDPTVFHRSFIADCEVYSDTGAIIYIGYD